ncbi:hypothetical protein MBEHAL_2012 [Halarchaeum acidiphilum MH1-52-1]|uniref:DUF7979 domain-containing protein n=1 Tax=Halarchaeum acidiphilum MH1-52-1 TaxID=1261545 RepID=U2YWU0_9EURY|nr:hypothetical protein [Halarchaeum acidiphilum]GAD53252.1 hypothetical protein MBEHAL_2012 [Halarchaeum acidiphilum MH1-52-1]
MNVRACAVVAGAVAVVTAGRAGIDLGTNAGTTDAATPTTSGTMNGASTNATILAGSDAIRYASLSNRSREVFPDARQNGSVTIRYPNRSAIEPFDRHAAVLYEGARYPVDARWDRRSYRFVSTVVPTNESTLPTDAEVTPYASLDDEAQAQFDAARRGEPMMERTDVPPSVRRNDTGYRTVYGHADIPRWTIRVGNATDG